MPTKRGESAASLHLSTEEAGTHGGKARREEAVLFSEEEICEKWKTQARTPPDLEATAAAAEERLITLQSNGEKYNDLSYAVQFKTRELEYLRAFVRDISTEKELLIEYLRTKDEKGEEAPMTINEMQQKIERQESLPQLHEKLQAKKSFIQDTVCFLTELMVRVCYKLHVLKGAAHIQYDKKINAVIAKFSQSIIAREAQHHHGSARGTPLYSRRARGDAINSRRTHHPAKAPEAAQLVKMPSAKSVTMTEALSQEAHYQISQKIIERLKNITKHSVLFKYVRMVALYVKKSIE